MVKSKFYKRPLRQQAYSRHFTIVTEGEKSEPQYFRIVKQYVDVDTFVKIVPPQSKAAATDPLTLLKRARTILPTVSDSIREVQTWIVCDRDVWTKDQLDAVYRWANENAADKHGLAMSNPKFEYWLLLHFENGSGLKSVADCDLRLKTFLPGYDKGIPERLITEESIRQAVKRAGQRPSTKGSWPKNLGETTVHLLIKELLKI